MAESTTITAQGGATTVGASRAAPTSGGALSMLGDILADESGRSSDDDKLAALKQAQAIFQKTGSFTDAQAKDFSNKVNNSSFARKCSEIDERVGRAMTAAVEAGGGDDIATIKGLYQVFDNLSGFERNFKDADNNMARLAAAAGRSEAMDKRVKAGAYVPGTPDDKVTDPEARAILEYSKRDGTFNAQSTNPMFLAFKERGLEILGVNAKAPRSFDKIQDMITLSAQAQKLLAGGRK